jgi:hypothetical protein
MDEGRRPKDKEGTFYSRGLVRDVADANMKKIRARLAERANIDSSGFLRDFSLRARRKCENR